MTERKEPWTIVRLLAFTQIVSWGSLYYAFTIVASDIQREFGWRTEVVFGAYSWSLLVAGLVSAPAGMLLDRFGGRPVMTAGSLLAGGGLILLALARSVAWYFLGWTVVGVAMALVMYEAAFATINREFLLHARRGISTLTLFGGFASTVFWPLTLKLNSAFGWRDTFLIYAGLHLALCMPMHALLSVRKRHPAPPHEATAARSYTLHEALRDPAFWKLAGAFASNMFIFSALSAHLIPLLQRFGHPAATAVLAAALIGPMQVAGRLGEMTFASRVAPQTVGRLTFSFLPAALLVLLLFGESGIAITGFCMLYGLGNGILTIVRGTVPAVLFGRENYGAISGALAAPSLLARAAGPLAIAFFVEFNASPHWLIGLLLLAAIMSLGCFLAALKARRAGIDLALTH